MKKIFFKLQSKQKQSGIALIFALAMLSLLLIMAIGFATSAIFEQKAATNSASTSNARIMAQSALNRVLALMDVYGESIQYSRDGATNSADMLSHLTTTLNGAPLYTWSVADPVEWEYLKVDDGTNNRLVGRFAYKVIPVAGLDPGSLVNQAVNEAAVTAAEQRLGLYVDEINIKSVSPDITAALAQKFNYTTCATPGFYPGPVPAAGWKNFKNLFTLTGVTDTTLQSKLQRWFMLDTDRSKSKEQYRIDQPAATFYHRFNLARSWSAADFPVAYPPTAMYEKILLDKNPTTSPGPDGIPDQMPTVFPASYSPVDRTDGYGIPWLAFFGYKTDGTLDLTQGATFGTTTASQVAARRRQIAANLVDYCRTDTDPPAIPPTSDVDPATWLTSSAPTFTGNKKTPYINELGFHVMVEAVQTSVGGTNTKGHGKGHAYGRNKKNSGTSNILDLSVEVDAVVELVDIYGVTLPAADSTVSIDYTLSYSVSGTAAPSGTITSSGTVTINVTKADWGSPQVRYATPATWTNPSFYSSFVIDGVSVAAGTTVNVAVNNISLKINNVVLNYNGKNYDYAYINTASTPVSTGTISIAANTTNAVDKDYFISFQAIDPRQNLNAGDWTVNQTAIITDGSWDTAQYNTLTGGGTLDAMNNNFGTSASGLDLETTANPAAASTAYIRQGPMQSPWELGFIHRGKAWETINLKQFDTTKSFLYLAGTPNIIPGGAAYAAGDANILNQVKMNGTLDNFKVNINSLYKDPDTAKYTALEALFTNIKTGCTDKSAPAATLNMLSAADITSLVTAITNKTKTAPYTNRAQIVNDIVAVAPILNYTTDAAKEELIGKFINLTDVGGKYFYVIVLAQAIKDIGGPSAGTADITIRKKKSDGTVISIPTRLGQFDCDPANNIYADEIVGEQKIRILVYLESTFNIPRILSYEYVE